MYIVVVGGGRVGSSIASALISGGHEAFLLDRDPDRVEAFRSEMGGVAGVGDGTSLQFLNEAGVSRASVLVAATGSDADNLAVCQLAKWSFQTPKTVALTQTPENALLLKTCGVDVALSISDLIIANVAASLPAVPLTRLMPVQERGLEVVGLKVPAGAEVAGKTLGELQLPYGASIVFIIRQDGLYSTPSTDTTLEAEDMALALCPVESTNALWELLTELK